VALAFEGGGWHTDSSELLVRHRGTQQEWRDCEGGALGLGDEALGHRGRHLDLQLCPERLRCEGRCEEGVGVVLQHGQVSGNTKRLVLQLQAMVKAGIAPDTVSYTTLIHACGKEGNIDKAEQLLSCMVEDGLSLNVISYLASTLK
jgi:pentatricopeptide repeat protein